MRCSHQLLSSLSILALVACSPSGEDVGDWGGALGPGFTGDSHSAAAGSNGESAGGDASGGASSAMGGAPSSTTGGTGSGAGGAGNPTGSGGMGGAATAGGAGTAPGPSATGGVTSSPNTGETGGAGNTPTNGETSGGASSGGPGGETGTGEPTTTGVESDDTGVSTGTDGSSSGPRRTYSFSDPNAKYPFPQRVKYPYGVQSDNVDDDFIASWYETWRSRYLTDCNGMVMPSTEDRSVSKVEAQGFAMIAAAYMADKATVDGLYAYYQSKRQSSSCNLSAWHTTCGGVQDAGAATDGDIDVASGLIVAHWQWPNDGYDDKARGVISSLDRMLTDCGGLTTVYPGCSNGGPWGGCDETDISYYSPGFFRYFAKISGDNRWAKLADDTNRIRDNAANPSTGLVPDWQSVQGRPGAGSRVGHYGFDAIRTPFKHALDYLWHGNEPTRAWCEKITTWAHGVGVGNIVDGYQLDGRVAGEYHNMAAVGSLAVCASANTQQVVDDFVAESATLRDDFWYSGYLGNLYLLAMSGNMWHRDMMPD